MVLWRIYPIAGLSRGDQMNQRVLAQIDKLADQWLETSDSLDILQRTYDRLAANSRDELTDPELIELSKQIHRCQDALREIVEARESMIKLLFD